jgi:phospholipid/cholesterol/gamma-HCH transport system ATP-binding protein
MIAIRDLHKALGGQPVLCGVDLDIERGETVALVGRSGAGKSVLLRHLVGLMLPDRGDVTIDGTSIPRANRRTLLALRRRMGYAFQDAALFDSLDIRRNLLLALSDALQRDAAGAERRILAALERVNLSADVLSRRPAELSGGMRKRAGVARAVIHDPQIILYDEPTTGLDPANVDDMNRLIRRIAADTGATAVVVTHDLDTLEAFADRVVCLADGRIVLDGAPEDFQPATLGATRRREVTLAATRTGRLSWS